MVRQQVKDLLFSAVRWLSLPSYIVAKLRYRTAGRRSGELAVHLGCGPRYIEGMVNLDANLLRRIDVWHDLRRRLPFPSQSVSLIYCCHVLEHLYPDEALRLLAEMRRVIVPSGVARIAVPSFIYALNIVEGDAHSTWPRRFDDQKAQAINFLFCEGQHKYAYSFSVLREFAIASGFSSICDYSSKHGTAPKRYGEIELGHEPDGSLIVECRP